MIVDQTQERVCERERERESVRECVREKRESSLVADVDFVFRFTYELFPNPSAKRLCDCW